jgi:Tat protein secretion system quality control protein TatD with DNase activity
MKLKTLLLSLLLLSGLSGVAYAEFPNEQMSDPARELHQSWHSSEYSGPIIDTHFHITPARVGGKENAEEYIEELLELLDTNNIMNIIEMPTPNDLKPGEKRERYTKHRMHAIDYVYEIDSSNKFLGFCEPTGLPHLYMSEALEDEINSALDELDSALKNDNCIGIGEFGPYHFAKIPKQKKSVIVMPLTFKPFLKMLSMIEDSGKYLVLHMEPMDSDGGPLAEDANPESYHSETLKLLDEILNNFPNLKLVLAHTAMTNSGNLKYLLDKYPNLISGIKIQGHHISKSNWNYLEPIMKGFKPYNNLYKDWFELIENYSNRFVIETDFKFLRLRRHFSGSPENYINKHINRVRKILGLFSKDTAEKIAYKNAQRYFLKY